MGGAESEGGVEGSGGSAVSTPLGPLGPLGRLVSLGGGGGAPGPIPTPIELDGPMTIGLASTALPSTVPWSSASSPSTPASVREDCMAPSCSMNGGPEQPTTPSVSAR